MFAQKKSDPESQDNVAKKGIKHIDAVVTGVILGGIVGSIYGVSKLKKKSTDTEHTHLVESHEPIKRKSFWQRLIGR